MMALQKWDEIIRQEHQVIVSQAKAMEGALHVDVGELDRRVVLSWILRSLSPFLELHFRKEEEVLFPALQQLLGEDVASVTILSHEHQQLRKTLRYLAELIQDPEILNWQGITLAVEAFLNLLEDHEKKEDRLVLDVLQYSLMPKELEKLIRDFQQVARKAHEEEGWPVPWWQRESSLGNHSKS